MRVVKVELGKAQADRSYSIYIGRGVLRDVGRLMKTAGLKGSVAIITNPVVGKLYAGKVVESLKASGFNPIVMEIPDGEAYKNLASVSGIYDRLIEFRMERSSAIVALGGGVTGDMAGFAAATYLRGVPYVQIPTTLLSQVDSSIGGKTGVNHALGKNLIGAFYQPKLVAIDPDALKTLPARELGCGLAEVVKHGVIRDEGYFSFLENNVDRILALSDEILNVIEGSCRIKAGVVSADEREAGLRAILNFGHTFGHAIEAVTGYSTYMHGEAVAVGMALAAAFSIKLGLCGDGEAARVGALLKMLNLPTEAPDLKAGEIYEAMLLDKKVKDAKLRFVLMRKIGEAEVREVSDAEVREFLPCVFRS
jgi:3-dehydroquinate synthase